MNSLADLVQAMKMAAMQAFQNSDPTAWMMGEVISTSPLQIQIEQRLTIDEDLLILTRNVTDYTVSISQDWGTGAALGSHSHSYSEGTTGGANLSHNHTVIADEITIHNGLEEGETVLLLRQDGGQKFIVVDRVVI